MNYLRKLSIGLWVVALAVLVFTGSTHLAIAQDTNTGGPANLAPGGLVPSEVTQAFPGIIVDMSPGTGSPPATLGGFTMTPVPVPGAPGCTGITPPGPLPTPGGGGIAVSPWDSQRCIGDGWETWSHGYTGDVYFTGGTMSQTIDLPSGTKAVYFYVEPNPFTVHDFEAIAQPGGVSTGVFQADGSGGATYVGFYATGSDTIQSITINSSADFATGEFGWNGSGGPGPSCVEEECATGLDILPGVGYTGTHVNMEVDVTNAPNDVSSFGFDVTYDPAILEYVGPTGVLDPADPHICDLLSGWTMVGINVLEPGVLRIGGFTVANAIEQGETGCMIKLEFHVLECEPTICYTVGIDDESLADHVEDWPVCHGCLCCGCPHDGDVDESESITPQDALYAFGFYLGMLPPCDEDGVGVPDEDCLTECQQDHADVCSPLDPGSDITPVDALCIFTAYMYGLTPEDPLPCGVCDD